ncbi:MAG TPA: aldose epimerase family protein [Polyangiaceae bacterium]|nr:aldose epimerase family protein [Polyangiaceae bacterium]
MTLFRNTRWSGVALAALMFGCSGAQSAPAETSAAAPEAVASAPAEAPKPAATPAKPAAIQKAAYGKLEDKDVDLYTLTNANGLVLKVATYGAIVTEFQVPDKGGKLGDIVLGFENLDGYVKGSPYFGATVGRVANRIRGAKFKLDGKDYKLAANNGQHHLHGGVKGWDKVIWTAEPAETPEGPALKLTYVSKDGEEGYPGTVTATAVYTLTNKNEFKVEMSATTDKTTIVNMAHHTYWNLGGFASGPITDQELTLFADKYTPGDPMVPTGQIKPVKGTPFDFTVAKPIGKDLKAAGGDPIGFDHNFVVNGDAHAMRPVAKLKDPKSGRVMTLEADQPGVQFYSGNFLDGKTKGKGVAYPQYSGLCLETQKFPNSINIPAWKDEVILKPGATYKHTMIHRFTTE